MACFTLFNGSCLLALTILAIIMNLIPLFMDYHDGHLFRNSISCYEWWLPGVLGGGILVIPAASMSLAARKGQKCNTRTGFLLSALFSLISIVGAFYCASVSLCSLVNGPLICNTASHSVDNCTFSMEDISSLSKLKFELKWFLEDECGINQTAFETEPTLLPNINVTRVPINESLVLGTTAEPNAQISEIPAELQKTIHVVTFTGLLLVAILEVIVSAMQIIVGIYGCFCRSSRRYDSGPV
ncbi:transmembrane 4 L6 family member 20-like [Leucoraja erinacea]|uniref:transmembrane 4 L6 family member 20-like n=1 Tax=Leucoraja erinaceus TaxID=7782 RepID=UPI00245761FE|nr:transmembrane 4 L6 family member 20-like [Leucoraja erinacea]